jgi:hypothetical protein
VQLRYFGAERCWFWESGGEPRLYIAMAMAIGEEERLNEPAGGPTSLQPRSDGDALHPGPVGIRVVRGEPTRTYWTQLLVISIRMESTPGRMN